MRVSVVVPVWNPGPSFSRCVDSLLTQSLPRSQYEIVLVDDGSTDGTAERLDALEAEHPGLVRVLHIPNSGWPGRPRNVGIDAARGTWVQLVDNDDTLPPYALERLADAGDEYEADLVMGRPASDFRGLVHTIYRQPLWTGTLRDFPELTTTLTPHKMFRRALLNTHGIRFPEGRVPLEDQMVVMAAYLHARRIVVLSDRVYYSYLRRAGSGRNAGDTPIDALRQSQAVAGVLDVVEQALDETGADAPFRDRVLRRFYQINLLPRLVDAGVMTTDAGERDAVVDEVRRLTASRFGPGVTESVGAAHRTLGHVLRHGDTAALLRLGANYRSIGLQLPARGARWEDGRLVLDLDGGILWRSAALRCDRVPGGWALPSTLAPDVPVEARVLDPQRDDADVELSLVSRLTSASFAADADLRVLVDDDGTLRVRGTARIDPDTALCGRPLEDGAWDLRARLRFAGWNRTCPVRVPGATDPVLPPYVTADGRTVAAVLPDPAGGLTLDVGQATTSRAALVAPGARLAVERGELLLTLDTLTAAPGGGGVVEVALAPTARSRSGPVVLRGSLEPSGGGLQARLPAPTVDGSWRPWLRLGDDLAAPARLPFTVRRRAGVVSAAPSPLARRRGV